MTAQEILDNAMANAYAKATENTTESIKNDAQALSEAQESTKNPIATEEEALAVAAQLRQLHPQKELVKELETRLKNYVEKNEAILLQNGSKSYTFPGTNVQVKKAENIVTLMDHPELMEQNEYEQAFVLANPANASAFEHKVYHNKLQSDEKTNALKLALGMRTKSTPKWSIVYQK